MTRRVFPSAAAVVALVLLVGVKLTGQPAAMPSTRNGDWTHDTADVRGTKYSPLDQINAVNFNQLEVAWRVKTDNLGTRPEFKLEGTPLAIRGVLYTTAGTRRSVVALDGRTGQNGSVGLMVTKTLVGLGDPQVTAPPGGPRGAMLRAYDKNNGTEVGAVWLPAGQSGPPMTYMADGKQYMIVAVSGGNYSGEYLAFAPPNAPRTISIGQP